MVSLSRGPPRTPPSPPPRPRGRGSVVPCEVGAGPGVRSVSGSAPGASSMIRRFPRFARDGANLPAPAIPHPGPGRPGPSGADRATAPRRAPSAVPGTAPTALSRNDLRPPGTPQARPAARGKAPHFPAKSRAATRVNTKFACVNTVFSCVDARLSRADARLSCVEIVSAHGETSLPRVRRADAAANHPGRFHRREPRERGGRRGRQGTTEVEDPPRRAKTAQRGAAPPRLRPTTPPRLRRACPLPLWRGLGCKLVRRIKEGRYD